jgi:hypothetical protein
MSQAEPKPTRSAHYRWTPEDETILRECQRLDSRSATDVIRQALRAYLRQLRREARGEAK